MRVWIRAYPGPPGTPDPHQDSSYAYAGLLSLVSQLCVTKQVTGSKSVELTSPLFPYLREWHRVVANTDAFSICRVFNTLPGWGEQKSTVTCHSRCVA